MTQISKRPSKHSYLVAHEVHVLANRYLTKSLMHDLRNSLSISLNGHVSPPNDLLHFHYWLVESRSVTPFLTDT